MKKRKKRKKKKKKRINIQEKVKKRKKERKIRKKEITYINKCLFFKLLLFVDTFSLVEPNFITL